MFITLYGYSDCALDDHLYMTSWTRWRWFMLFYTFCNISY